MERAGEPSFPDGLALAFNLYDFAHLQLSNWHKMLLDQMYQADADAQLRDGILQSLEDYGLSGPISQESNKQTMRPNTKNRQSQYYSQPMHNLGNVPMFLRPSYRNLSPQQEAYAQAMQNLRNEPESFAPDFSRQKPCSHLSPEERQQALFRELLYYRDAKNILAPTNTMSFLFRAIPGFFFGLIFFSCLASRILMYL